VDVGEGKFNFPGQESFTVSAWIKADAIDQVMVLTHDRYTTDDRAWRFGVYNGSIAFLVSPNGADFTWYEGSSLTTGTWYYLTVVRVGIDVSFYINGSFDSTHSTDNIYDADSTVEARIG